MTEKLKVSGLCIFNQSKKLYNEFTKYVANIYKVRINRTSHLKRVGSSILENWRILIWFGQGT